MAEPARGREIQPQKQIFETPGAVQTRSSVQCVLKPAVLVRCAVGRVDGMNRFWLSDESHNSTAVFTTGATLFIEGQGLHPSTLYDFHLSDAGSARRVLLARYGTDNYGCLAAMPLIPAVGLSRLGVIPSQSSFVIRAEVSGGTGLEFEDLNFAVSSRHAGRRVYACDRNAKVHTGMEKGSQPVATVLHNFPEGPTWVYLVRRKPGWRTGDPIEPVVTRKGAVCSRLIYHDGAPERMVKLADSRDIPAGGYQFVVRSISPGSDAAGSRFLLRDDVVSDRHAASLVILLPFSSGYAVSSRRRAADSVSKVAEA